MKHKLFAYLQTQYHINPNGVVLSRGRFHGEHISTVYFYEHLMDAMPMSNGTDLIWVLELADGEAAAFNLPESTTHFSLLLDDDDGFVFGEPMSQKEYEKAIARCQVEEPDQEEPKQ